MPYLTGNQRTRAYGSYNSKNNTFMLNTINNGSCWIPRQARCQAPCGITFPKWKSDEYQDGIPWDEELYKSLVQGRQNAIKNLMICIVFVNILRSFKDSILFLFIIL